MYLSVTCVYSSRLVPVAELAGRAYEHAPVVALPKGVHQLLLPKGVELHELARRHQAWGEADVGEGDGDERWRGGRRFVERSVRGVIDGVLFEMDMHRWRIDPPCRDVERLVDRSSTSRVTRSCKTIRSRMRDVRGRVLTDVAAPPPPPPPPPPVMPPAKWSLSASSALGRGRKRRRRRGGRRREVGLGLETSSSGYGCLQYTLKKAHCVQWVVSVSLPWAWEGKSSRSYQSLPAVPPPGLAPSCVHVVWWWWCGMVSVR